MLAVSELFDSEEVIVLRSSIESSRRVIRRAVTDMQASMSRARDNLNRNNVFGAKDELEAVLDLSQLLAQSVQEILAALDQLEELYSMQVKRA